MINILSAEYRLVVAENDLLVFDVVVQDGKGYYEYAPKDNFRVATPVTWIVEPSSGRIEYPAWIRISVASATLRQDKKCHANKLH